MKKIQYYKMPLKLRWYFAKELIRTAFLMLIGWEELERNLTKDTHTMIFKQKVHFKVQ